MSNIFKLGDIKAGYLLEVEDSSEQERFFMTVVPSYIGLSGTVGLACVCPGEHWHPMTEWGPDLVYKMAFGKRHITKVYGYTNPRFLLDNKPYERELLWERKEPKHMTLREIQEALGYEIEIVPEKED